MWVVSHDNNLRKQQANMFIRGYQLPHYMVSLKRQDGELAWGQCVLLEFQRFQIQAGVNKLSAIESIIEY